MKLILASLALVSATAIPAHAELFGNRTTGGAILGGIAGAIIGNNSGNHNGLQGAAIGAAAGALIGASSEARSPRYYTRDDGYIYSGHRYGRPYYSYGHYQPAPRYHSAYCYTPTYYPRARSGLFLGGVTGAIVGHNSGAFRHQAWRGAAWGATTGWLIGAIADERARDRERVIYVTAQPEAAEPATPASTDTAKNVTIINNYYGTSSGTPMSSATSLFGR